MSRDNISPVGDEIEAIDALVPVRRVVAPATRRPISDTERRVRADIAAYNAAEAARRVMAAPRPCVRDEAYRRSVPLADRAQDYLARIGFRHELRRDDDRTPALPTRELLARAIALPAPDEGEPIADPIAWANCPEDVP